MSSPDDARVAGVLVEALGSYGKVEIACSGRGWHVEFEGFEGNAPTGPGAALADLVKQIAKKAVEQHRIPTTPPPHRPHGSHPPSERIPPNAKVPEDFLPNLPEAKPL